MKKRFLTLILASILVLSLVPLNAAHAADQSVEISTTNFPDKVFRDHVLEHYDVDDDGWLDAEELEMATSLDVTNFGIGSLQGVELLTHLDEIYCSGNNLTALDVSGFPDLRILSCSDNALTELDVSENPKLIHLDCSRNLLTSLDTSENQKLDT